MRILRILSFAVLGSIIALIYQRPETGEGASESADWPQAENTIAETQTAFEPSSLKVRVGETVTFLNRDAIPHALRIDEQDLTWQAPGESVEWKAEAPGVYQYACNIHPEMTGEIVVK
ncbi:MAG: cupredoxin domain-containing protein [Coriobacteriia bacterium]